jgi:hypothetical protein
MDWRVLSGPFFAGAFLIALSGLGKLRRPEIAQRALLAARFPASPALVRTIGLIELAVGAISIVFPIRSAVLSLGAIYALFAAFLLIQILRNIRDASCGCFSKHDVPPNLVHVVLNVLAAVVAVLVATTATDVEGLAGTLRGLGWSGPPFVVGILTIALLASAVARYLPSAFFSVQQAIQDETVTPAHRPPTPPQFLELASDSTGSSLISLPYTEGVQNEE